MVIKHAFQRHTPVLNTLVFEETMWSKAKSKTVPVVTIKLRKQTDDVNDSGVAANNHTCGVCGKNFTTRLRKNSHIRNVHIKKKDHMCDECDAAFKCGSKLKEHEGKVHQKKKDLECELCGMTFSVKAYLKRHVEGVHLKVQRYKCQECDFRSSHATSLYTHRKNVHLQVRLWCRPILPTAGHTINSIPNKCQSCTSFISYSQEIIDAMAVGIPFHQNLNFKGIRRAFTCE